MTKQFERSVRISLAVCLVVATFLFVNFTQSQERFSLRQTRNGSGRSKVFSNYEDSPLVFERNEGQFDGRTKYLARGDGYTLFLAADKAVMSFAQKSSHPRDAMQRRIAGFSSESRTLQRRGQQPSNAAPPGFAVLEMDLVGSQPGAQVTGTNILPGKSNYFIGSDARKWRKGVSQFARVQYKDVYPGIDLIYHGEGRQLEFDFSVSPGADPSRVSMNFGGSTRTALDSQGNLILSCGAGDLTLGKPIAYQLDNGHRHFVNATFVLKSNHVGMELDSYDRNKELVIDPSITYATYLGGKGEDEGFGVAVDSSGNAYITGETSSISSFPGDAAGFAGYGLFDAFVTKLDPNGNLLYTTFVGGTGDDTASAIAVDATGAAYVAGITNSMDFPVTAGAPQTTYGGGINGCLAHNVAVNCNDAFAFKLDPTGTTVLYATYLGGSSDDESYAIALDGSNNAYLAGDTYSADFPFSHALFPFNPGNVANASDDAFVAEINSAGTSFIYSTALGGSNFDLGNGIAVDNGGDVYVTGLTDSPNFPTTAGSHKTTCGTDGNCNFDGVRYYEDAFVTKISPGGTALAYSTYLGGSSDDEGLGIALDGSGSAYLTGLTSHNNPNVASADFPIVGGFQSSFGTGVSIPAANGFVTRLNATGSTLIYSSYLGGGTFDAGIGIALDSNGNAYVTGTTLSPDFPVVTPFQQNLRGNSDAFLGEVNASGNSLVYSSWMGGSGDENYSSATGSPFGGAIAVDTVANVYLTGSTTSSKNDFPVSANALQKSYGGKPFDGFVAAVSPNGFTIAASTLTPSSIKPGGQSTSSVAIAPTGTFNATIALACIVTPQTGNPPDCSFNPPTIANSSGTSTLSVTTSAISADGKQGDPKWRYALWLPVGGIALAGSGVGLRRRKSLLFAFCVVTLGIAALSSCGGTINPGSTISGPYSITVEGIVQTGPTAGNAQPANVLTLIVQ